MTNFKVKNLTTNTPKNDQSKLETSLKGLPGVDSVKLYPEKSEFSLTCQESKQPKQDALEAACTSAGFTLSAPSAASPSASSPIARASSPIAKPTSPIK